MTQRMTEKRAGTVAKASTINSVYVYAAKGKLDKTPDEEEISIRDQMWLLFV